MSISTHTSTWQSRTKQQLLDDIEAIIETRDRAVARAERAETERDEAIAALQAGDACGAVGCRALAERDEAVAKLRGMEAKGLMEVVAQGVQIVSDGREAFLDSPALDPAWIAGWHAATDHHANRLRAALDTPASEGGEGA